ncbi:MAG: uroporphyrinogen-III synthase [Mycobacteriales bacterium]
MVAKKKPQGSLALAGTGPGDPALLTLRAAELLAAADVVVGDADLTAAVRDRCRPDVTFAGEGAVQAAKAGHAVVALVASDVLSTPDGVREATALAKAAARVGLPFEVVPGVPRAIAVPGYAGVALGAQFAVATVGVHLPDPDWRALAAFPGTVVLELLVPAVAKAAVALTEHGRPADTPVALTVHGTTAGQRTIVSTLECIENDASGVAGVAVLAVGAAVRARAALSWWESRPLFGWRVLVPRTRAQAGEMAELLRTYGAEPLEVPTIAVEPPRTPAPMERAVRGLVTGRYAWVLFTSANAVKAVREKLEEVGLDARAFAGVKVAAVGEATAGALVAFGIRPDLVPSGEQSSEGLLADFPPYDDVFDMLDRVFLPRADIATETLVAGLKERGWAIDDVTAYRTVRAAPPPAPVREAIKGGAVDAVLFTSSSTVRNLVGIAGKPHESTVIACIGPQTAATARELGLRVDVLASVASVEVLVADLATFAAARGAPPAASRPRRGSAR